MSTKEIGVDYNITASKIAPIVKEYSKDPYWGTIPCYMDVFAVYLESLMTPEQIKERVARNTRYHNRFGTLVEPFMLQEFFNILEISEEMQKSVIIHNKMYKNKNKIACTPDFLIQNFPKEILTTINNVNQFKSLLTDNFRFNFEPGFIAKDNNFIMEVKSRSLSVVRRDYTKTLDSLIPDPVTLLQIQTGLLITGYSWGIIATLVMTDEGIKFHYYFVNANLKIQEIIQNSVAKYFNEVAKGKIPRPAETCSDQSHQLLLNNNFTGMLEIDLSKDNLLANEEILKSLIEDYWRQKNNRTLTALERYLAIYFLKNYQEVKIITRAGNYIFSLFKKPDVISSKHYVPGEILKKGKFSLEIKKQD